MKQASRLLLLLEAVAVAAWPVAASATDDAIAAQADACLASRSGQTTAGMTECSHQAYIAYDKQMNELYQHVLLSVDPQSRALIAAAQQRWLAYREAQQAADDGPWRADRGSMASPELEALAVDAIRHRIEELRYYVP